MMFVSFNSNTTGVNGVTGTAYPSRLHELTPDFYCILLCSVLRPFSVLLYFFYWLSFADCKTILSDPIHYSIKKINLFHRWFKSELLFTKPLKTLKGLSCCFETSCNILGLLSVSFYNYLKKYPIILIGRPLPPYHLFFTQDCY
jgi:hypothetical protein